MGSKRYTVLGWLTWKVASRVARRKLQHNRTLIQRNRAKLGAAGAVLLVVVGGVLAGRSDRDD